MKIKTGRARAEELVDFLQDVALGKRQATDKEIEDATKELDKYLPGLAEESGGPL
jgi:hypothetical protein